LESHSLNLLWAGRLVDELIRNGCDYFCVCPGSRSTPLTVAAARHQHARCSVCYDERGAAFRALGFARATGRAGVVITTSGTAVANLYPAVAEAAHDHVPLILLTADRPPELLDTGANQTMVRQDLFAPFLRWQFNLPCPTASVRPEFVQTTVDQAIHRSGGHHAGPVQINCMYREPFLDSGRPMTDRDKMETGPGPEQEEPFTRYSRPSVRIEEEDLDRLAGLIDGAEKGLILVGRLFSEMQRGAIRRLIETLNWPVYADLSSGLRLAETGTHIMRYFDQQLLSKTFCERFRPDVVLHLGGRVISKRVGLFFEQCRSPHYIVVDDHSDRFDPIHCVTERVACDVAWFAEALSQRLQPRAEGGYGAFSKRKAADVDRLIAEMIAQEENITEPFVARRVSERVPEGGALVVSNSMPVRDVDLYGCHGRDDIRVALNRGVSGIDGILATAVGFAEGTGRSTTVLIGDLALIHDLNSLTMLQRCRQPVIVVVVNNHGGGIFHFLPIAEQADVFEEYFVTPHGYSFAGLGETFGIDAVGVASKVEFDQAYTSAVESGRSALIEVVTAGRENFLFRKRMKKAILDLLQDEAKL